MKLIKRAFRVLVVFFILLEIFGLLAIEDLVQANVNDYNIERKYVAFTFDDGPKSGPTEELLSGLKERNAKATFFVLGMQAEIYPELVQQIINEGHEIGNHTYNHQNLNGLSETEITQQIEKTNLIIEKITGKKPQILRPGYGLYNYRLLTSSEMPIVLWSIDTMDWSLRNSKKIYNRNIDEIEDGDIILMHDVFYPSVKAALKMMDELAKSGFEFVTVSELAKIKGFDLLPDEKYSNFNVDA